MLLVLDAAVLAGATCMILLLWFQGSLFATLRAYPQAWTESNSLVKSTIGELLTCPLCLSVHVAGYLCLFAFVCPIIARGFMLFLTAVAVGYVAYKLIINLDK
jgi:hypothetical protein